MRAAPDPRRLGADEACFRSDVRALGIASSEDAKPSAAPGDRRGERALELALRGPAAGYHAFVCGIQGPDRLEQIATLVRSMVGGEGAPCDFVYVHNFSEPDRPRPIRLAAGQGRQLRSDLEAFVKGLHEDLPKAFREEAFDEEKQRLIESFGKRQEEQQRALEKIATESGFAIVVTPEQNVALLPVVDGKPVESADSLRLLGEERLREIEEARKSLARKIRDHLEDNRIEHHRLDEEIRRVEREFADRIVRRRAQLLAESFGVPELTHHLEDLVDHILDHLEPFRGDGSKPQLPFTLMGQEPPDPFAIYDVNVVVDNSRMDSPRVVVVDSPTYKNLFGAIDRNVDRFGQVSTDFRRIHAGALLEAEGGVVILNAEDALVEPFVWRILRRALRSGRVEIEAYDPFVVFTPATLRPQPIQVETKVVLLGPRWLFEMLLALDDEFPDLFKVLADFAPDVDRDEEQTRQLCGRVAAIVKDEALPAFEAGALDAVVELSVREAGDRRKLMLGSQRVFDAVREAGWLARAAGRAQTTREDVFTAIADRVDRLDRIEQSIREAIDRGILLIDVEGVRVGQLNGLSVSELGGHRFGRPSRLTASIGIGTEGVVSVDRETHLSGATHDKGVLILGGFLRDRFARRRPLSLTASVAFEQSYGLVDGDSASLAELVAILSRIGDFALRQDVAVTGSVNQAGEVQAVGGINEKIEGFFDCCRTAKLSGSQGVVFPAANEEHLALRADVTQAVAEGRFHLYPVRTVDEALEALTGFCAGSVDDTETLYGRVDGALDAMAQSLKEFAGNHERGGGPITTPRP
jgi:predicted ATP-dependent protease